MILRDRYFCSLTDKFTFGKYKSYTLEDVLVKDPSYVKWCLASDTEFYLDRKLIKDITSFFPMFLFRLEFMNKVISVDNQSS